MDEIVFPLKLEELLQADSGFQVVCELSLCELSDDEIKGHFEGDPVLYRALLLIHSYLVLLCTIVDMASLTSSEGGLDQLHQDTVDALYSLVTNFTALSDENKELFVEALTELTAAAVGSIGPQLAPPARAARKQLVYFLTELVKLNEALERDEGSDPADKVGRAAACTPARLHACMPARLHACTPVRRWLSIQRIRSPSFLQTTLPHSN